MHVFFLKKYFFVDSFEPNLIKFQDKNTSIIYRNYTKKKNLDEIIKLKNFCEKKNYKFFLANDIKLAIKLGLNGAYLPSFNNNFNHLSYSLKKNFILLGSAHNISEIRIKQKQKVNKIFLSSIFKKNKNYLGINKFKNLVTNLNSSFVALGGVSETNFKKLKLVNIKEFAGIQFFKKKAPLKGAF
tara:strand:- start:121 stop:675 length:555 start_codon:yes stop_codon:yes gene_type:complete